MCDPVIMPKAGMLMHFGTILEWYVKEGTLLKKGDRIAHIETDKATLDIEAERDGTILKILNEEGTRVPVTHPIAWIGKPGEKIPISHPALPTMPVNIPVVKPLALSITETAEPLASAETRTIAATPAARRTASEEGISLESVKPSGNQGQILLSDVLEELQGGFTEELLKPVIEQDDWTLPLTTTEQIMGKRMSVSARHIPQTSCSIEADATALLKLREELKQSGDTRNLAKASINDFLIAALARGAAEERRFNSQYDHTRLIMKRAVNVGIAVNTSHGLVVPVIRHADKLTLTEIAKASTQLARAAEQNELTPHMIEGATITVSNLGPDGVSSFVPLINPPQTAILGSGAARKRFIPDSEGKPVLKTFMNLTLTYDHRVGGGADAAKLIQSVIKFLSEPETLLQ